MHCSIIGTCLGHSDLLRIGRKNGYAPDANATEYHVHSFFVQCAEEKSRLSRQLHKALDTRYRVAILASNAAQNEEDLNAFWSDAFAGGDIAGAWWALVSHPLTSDELMIRAFGEVHMMSHLTSATHRAVADRLKKTKLALADAKRRLDSRTRERQRITMQRTTELNDLKLQLRTAEQKNTALQAANDRLCELENGNEIRSIQRHNAKLATDLKSAQRSEDRIQQHCKFLEQELSTLRTRYDQAMIRLKALENECSALEATVNSSICHPKEPVSATMNPINLQGCRVVYVGGRTSSIDHFRTLTENLKWSIQPP